MLALCKLLLCPNKDVGLMQERDSFVVLLFAVLFQIDRPKVVLRVLCMQETTTTTAFGLFRLAVHDSTDYNYCK